MLLLLGIFSGFILGLVAALGVVVARAIRHDPSWVTLDALLLGLSCLAAFGLGAFIGSALG